MKYLLFSLFLVSFAMNIQFILQNKQEKTEAIASVQKELFTEKLFSDGVKLKDYSDVKYTLEEEGKKIIKNAREFHSSPALVKGDTYNKYVCAGFLFDLSARLWGSYAPFSIGMMEQKTKTPADAWQLPDSYTYMGGKILYDLSSKFDLQKKDYWEKITKEDIQNFYSYSFSEEALLGDIGFLYKDTNYMSELMATGNANSHIVKNLGVSSFNKKVTGNIDGKENSEIFSEVFQCNGGVFNSMKQVLSHYEMYIDGKKMVYKDNDFYYLSEKNEIDDKVIFKELSEISIQDITLIHFFKGAQVNGLFELTCQGIFFPINVISINPRFVEKM